MRYVAKIWTNLFLFNGLSQLNREMVAALQEDGGLFWVQERHWMPASRSSDGRTFKNYIWYKFAKDRNCLFWGESLGDPSLDQDLRINFAWAFFEIGDLPNIEANFVGKDRESDAILEKIRQSGHRGSNVCDFKINAIEMLT